MVFLRVLLVVDFVYRLLPSPLLSASGPVDSEGVTHTHTTRLDTSVSQASRTVRHQILLYVQEGESGEIRSRRRSTRTTRLDAVVRQA